MNIDLSAHDRRTLLRGVAAIAMLVLLGRIVPGTRDWASSRREDAERLHLESRRAEQSALDAPRTQILLQRARARLVGYDSATLDAGSATRASAMLAALVRDASDAAEARVGALQLRTDSVSSGLLARVSVRASVSGDLESLALFIEGLEAGPELLAIRELSIVQPEPGLLSPRAETLRGEVLVEGVFRAPADAKARR